MNHSPEGNYVGRLVPYAALNPRYETRNFMSRSCQTIRGRLPCSKSSSATEIESTLEALFALRAEASAVVSSFVTQPFQFRAVQQKLPIGYTPDADVCLSSGERCLVEIKREVDLRRADMLARLTAIRHTTEASGIRLLYSTDAQLRRDDENERIRTVRIHARTFTQRESEALNGRLGHRSTLTLGEAAAVLGSRAAALHLIAIHVLYVDYRQPLTVAAVVSRNPKEADHDVALFSDW